MLYIDMAEGLAIAYLKIPMTKHGQAEKVFLF
jgi:hypothetical protein